MTAIPIHKIPPLALWRLSRGGKKRNKKLLEVLARHNGRLTPPAEILSLLGLGGGDLSFLNDLGQLPDGWFPYVFSPEAPGDQRRLAALGLILIDGRRRTISLTDAGRFLLVLALSDSNQGTYEGF